MYAFGLRRAAIPGPRGTESESRPPSEQKGGPDGVTHPTGRTRGDCEKPRPARVATA